MPHINRIRVNNVKYNFGTQYYDDFVLRLSGKNTIYDLANGGGKSVLMLLLLQNMLPNCTLDEKQPIEKLFRSGNDNKVIHSLIEWRLNDSDVKNQYKYMTTGFCARKAQRDITEDDENVVAAQDTASVEYFNYCIFYREFNANDIVNLPLADDRERISYNGLKSYLRSLEKRDYSLEIKIFERKGDYQRFISQYGIYESEWEIIRGINKTEGHVRTYFESNYKTTRKVVEDLFIDEIIEKSFRNKIVENEAREDMMAQTLLDIKDKLVELSLKNSEIQNFDRQTEVFTGFAEQLGGLETAYEKSDNARGTLLGLYDYATKAEAEELKARERLAESRLQLQSELTEQKRLSDTAQISIEESRAKKLAEVLRESEEQIALSEDKLQRLKSDLTYKESVNDYLDYVYYKAERDKLKEELDNAMKDKGELSDNLSELAARIKELTDSELTELLSEAFKQEKELTETSEELILATDKERETDKELAVFSDKLSELEKKEKSVNTRYNELMAELGVLIGTDIEALLLKKQKLLKEAEQSVCECDRRYAEVHDALLEERINFEKSGEELNRLNIEVNKNIKLVEAQKEDKRRISAMKSAYGVRELKDLRNACLKILGDISAKNYSLNSEKSELAANISAYQKGFAIAKTDRHEKLKDYIERCYGYRVQYGEDYLLSKEQYERERLVAEFPLISFGFVVEEGLELLSYDEKLAGELKEYPVPIFLRSAIEGGIFSEKESVIYPNTLIKWYTDDEVRAETLSGAEQRLSELAEELKKGDSKIEVLYDDYDFVNHYVSIYGEAENSAWEDYERAGAELEAIKLRREENLLRIQGYDEEEKKLAASLSELKAGIKALSIEIERLKELEVCSKDMDGFSVFEKELLNGREAALKKQRELNAYIEELSELKKSGEERFANINAGIVKLEKDWDELYNPFYKGGKAADSTLDYNAAVIKFTGIRNAFDKEYSWLEDKRQLINNYEYAMSKALQSIAYNGVDEAFLRAEHEALRLVKTEKTELLSLRDSINRAQASLKALQKDAGAARDEKNRIEGGVSHAVKSIIEKYGVYEEIAIDGNAEQFVAARRIEIDRLTKELSMVSEKLLEFDGRSRDFGLMKKELERIFKSENITITEGNGNLIIEAANVEALYEKTLKEFDSLRKEIYERREDFERAKSRLMEVLSKLGAHGLATELREHVPVPVTSAEVGELKANIAETISCIKLEKERVMRGIEDMQAIKDTFEEQCLQTCENIRLELDKLSKLSTIKMDDELISIISLKVPYEEEAERKLKMSQYIDTLVAQADSIDNQMERLKYIRGGLAWKRLFAVIVTDMNAIRLNLYKRERIKEQSRYLRYEEAVGSTGQSQGIYIQFLIGVINYIANINSPDAHTGLRKVIFIDNPFGAAKDIYIWEPIFKLLKTNNVQLIVPARGATPAITGRFDVNYVLGQKLIGGRQQTVVVDYFSSVTREKLEYKNISFEQATLDSLIES